MENECWVMYVLHYYHRMLLFVHYLQQIPDPEHAGLLPPKKKTPEFF